MRTDHRALAALDADLRIPSRNFESEIAFLPSRRSSGECAIARECADWKFVALPCVNRSEHIALEIGAPGNTGGSSILLVTVAGTFTSNKWASVSSTANMFFLTTSSPFLP